MAESKKERRLLWWAPWLLPIAFIWTAALRSQTRPATAHPNQADNLEDFRHSIDRIRTIPAAIGEYDYIMTARVRLLLFWAGKDDVGGGYIRRGTAPDDPTSEFLQIVMGSDPAKAPRAINRWGAATERVQFGARGGGPDSSTFFGFMKVYKGTSPTEMKKELDGEKGGSEFLFSAILNESDKRSSFAKTVPFASRTDFNIHQLDQAEPVVFDELQDLPGKTHEVDSAEFRSCGRPQGFLSSVKELVDDALDGKKTPEALCYIYNAQFFKLTLAGVAPVEHESVHISLNGASTPYLRSYDHLVQARFENFNETTHQGSTFDLLLGTERELRGIPVRISYQPNWWFQVVLNLKAPDDSKTAGLR